MTDDLAREMYLAETAVVREHLAEHDQTTPLRDRIAAALYERERPPREPAWVDAYPADREVFEAMADAVLAMLPAPADQAAVLREAAQRLRERAEACKSSAFQVAFRAAADGLDCDADDAELRRVADETATTETQACDSCEGVDPDTCFNNPHRPPEQCPRSEFDGYGLQCQKPAGHNLCTFEEQPAAGARQDGADRG
ncbi:hypothetical protein ACFZCM_03320 [Streptomyces rochei]|uniref:hypothetical protein n=1 Tax=Streptomyces rochei TaxID=1928 RepID=UPI0036F0251B